MLVIVPAWSQNQDQLRLPYKYKLYKVFPYSRESVQFLKKIALSAAEQYHGLPPIFLTPLGQYKTSYVLIPHDKNQNITDMFHQEHIPYKPLDTANIKSAELNNEMHRPSEFPPQYSRQQGHIIESPRVTNWGTWGDWAQCPPFHYVAGMQLKTQYRQDVGDETALNAIRLLCVARGSYFPMQSLEGDLGKWGQTFHCPSNSHVIGFQLRSESDQGAGDNTAGNNLRIICNAVPERIIEGDGESFGSWTFGSWQECPKGQVVVGFRTQVQSNQGDGDDTALNNIDMECAPHKPL